MATTLEDIHRKIIRETPIEQRLEGLTPEDILKVVPLEEFLEFAKHSKKSKESKEKPKKTRKSQK
jgi:hypothetical protein